MVLRAGDRTVITYLSPLGAQILPVSPYFFENRCGGPFFNSASQLKTLRIVPTAAMSDVRHS